MSAVRSLWILHIVLLPIYVFGSGSVQPSHLVLLLAFFFYLISPQRGREFSSKGDGDYLIADILKKKGKIVCFLFALFALYVAIVNSFWSVALNKYTPLLFASFQIYNLILVYFIYRLIVDDFRLFMRSTWIGFSIAVILVLFSVSVGGFDTASREEGLFNNPNQLAFFCLSSCLVFFISDQLQIGSSVWNRGLIGISCFLCLLTLSRAGMVTCAIIFLFSFVDQSGRSGKIFLMALVAVGLVAASSSIDLTDRIKARNQQTQAVFGNQVEGRGYDRMLFNPEYLLLGAGEGENRRFGGFLASIGGEMHSSVGTLLFSYGIVGLLIYSSIWYLMVTAGPGLVFKACALAPIVYGITHNGLRFSAAMIAIMIMLYGGLIMKNSKIVR